MQRKRGRLAPLSRHGRVPLDEQRRRFGAMQSGLDIHYDVGEGHPLRGRRMPDLDLENADSPLRVFTLLRDARPALLNLGESGSLDIAPWADRVQLVEAEFDGECELPGLGPVTARAAVSVRPDGHVAWVGDGTDEGLCRHADDVVLAAHRCGSEPRDPRGA